MAKRHEVRALHARDVQVYYLCENLTEPLILVMVFVGWFFPGGIPGNA